MILENWEKKVIKNKDIKDIIKNDKCWYEFIIINLKDIEYNKIKLNTTKN